MEGEKRARKITQKQTTQHEIRRRNTHTEDHLQKVTVKRDVPKGWTQGMKKYMK